MFQWLKSEILRIGNTCMWSWEGWHASWQTEKSLRQWTIANIISASLAFYLDFTSLERALIVCFGLLILAAELINSAIEACVDYISEEPHPLAKKAKDAGSACVALTAITAGVMWLFMLLG